MFACLASFLSSTIPRLDGAVAQVRMIKQDLTQSVLHRFRNRDFTLCSLATIRSYQFIFIFKIRKGQA